jgi:hypothetical protein
MASLAMTSSAVVLVVVTPRALAIIMPARLGVVQLRFYQYSLTLMRFLGIANYYY